MLRAAGAIGEVSGAGVVAAGDGGVVVDVLAVAGLAGAATVPGPAGMRIVPGLAGVGTVPGLASMRIVPGLAGVALIPSDVALIPSDVALVVSDVALVASGVALVVSGAMRLTVRGVLAGQVPLADVPAALVALLKPAGLGAVFAVAGVAGTVTVVPVQVVPVAVVVAMPVMAVAILAMVVVMALVPLLLFGLGRRAGGGRVLGR